MRTVTEILQLELGEEPGSSTLLDVERVEQKVRNYCRIGEIPAALNFTMADMVLELQKARTGSNEAISEVTMGDTSYTFKVDKAIDGLMKNYTAELQRFRRLTTR